MWLWYDIASSKNCFEGSSVMPEQNLNLSEILDRLDTGQELLDTNIIKKGDELDD